MGLIPGIRAVRSALARADRRGWLRTALEIKDYSQHRAWSPKPPEWDSPSDLTTCRGLEFDPGEALEIAPSSLCAAAFRRSRSELKGFEAPIIVSMLLAASACARHGGGEAVKLAPRPHPLVDNFYVAARPAGDLAVLGGAVGTFAVRGRCLELRI